MENQITNENKKNLFDPDKLRLNQDFTKLMEVKKELLTIPVRKPNKQEFIRVHPERSYQLETAVLEFKEDRETYLVDKSLWGELSHEIIPKILFTTITRQGVLMLWPVRLHGQDGRLDQWNESALGIAEIAKTKWVRVVSNMSLGAYEPYIATGNLPEPEFPTLTFKNILETAFRDKYVQDPDHPVIKRLRGANESI
jgi:hypothetical protein